MISMMNGWIIHWKLCENIFRKQEADNDKDEENNDKVMKRADKKSLLDVIKEKSVEMSGAN